MGTKDKFTNLEDARWARDTMVKSVKFYKEYNLGHVSYAVANDMSYMEDVIAMLDKHSSIS